MIHVVTQVTGLALGQAQGNRLVGGVKIVDIAPVGRRLPRCRPRGFQQAAQYTVQQLTLAHPGAAQQKDVVALMGNLQCKLQGVHSTALAEMFGQRLQFLGGLEGQLGRITMAVQPFERERGSRPGRFQL